MSKGFSGLFHGTLGTSYINGSQNEVSYSDRGIEIPEHVKKILSKLKEKGDTVTGNKDSFSMKDVSIMSKETGAEFARVSIGEKTYLIRGDTSGAVDTNKLLKKIEKYGGSLDFHSHPHDNDCVPSKEDRTMLSMLKRLTGQSESKIVTPNGRISTFNEHGVIETGSVSNVIDHDMKEVYTRLFGGE